MYLELIAGQNGCEKLTSLLSIQWNLSNPDTLGTEESVLISELSSFQGYIVYKPLKNGVLAGQSVLYIEVVLV